MVINAASGARLAPTLAGWTSNESLYFWNIAWLYVRDTPTVQLSVREISLITCPDVLVVLIGPRDAEASLLKANPVGRVPVLLLEDETALYDSRVIAEYLDSASPVGRLIPHEPRERIEVKRWEALADETLASGVLARLERARAHPLARPHRLPQT